MLKKDIIEHALRLWINKNNIDLIILKVTGLTKNQLFLTEKIENKHIEKIKNDFLKQ